MKQSFGHLEKYRIKRGPLASTKFDRRNGAFVVPNGKGVFLRIIASDGSDWEESGLDGQPWEHVSVSTPIRCPTWAEMDFVKRLFWEDSETVIQFHVPAADHIDMMPYCLHLWRPVGQEIPRPPAETVGIGVGK